MKLNEKELSTYAQSANGRADKEGVLWIKEFDGKAKKREVLTRRWFKLIGNLLFYFKSDVQSSAVLGLIILIRSHVEAEKDNPEIKFTFRLTFDEDSTTTYQLAAENPQEMVEWMLALRSVGYEYLIDAASQLRAKIFHITAKDPIPKGNPLAHRHLRAITDLPPSVSTISQGEPLLNLSLGCSSLVSPRKTRPSPLIITNVRTAPQVYWSKLAQTEIVENNSDPHFFTVVLLPSGATLTSTEMRFEVFDVVDISGTKMLPIGVAHCTVKDILQASGNQARLQIIQGKVVQGYLSVLAWKESQSPTVLSPTSPDGPSEQLVDSYQAWRREPKSGSLKLPFNRLIMTNFQFPVLKTAAMEGEKKVLKVSEVMGEGIYSWSIPKQLLNIFIADDNQSLRQYQALNVLKEEWEITRQEVMLEHSEAVAYYRSELNEMDQEQAKGITFKKSTEKGSTGYEFVPTNLHIQYLRVEENERTPPSIAYEVVTVGAPTAYGLKTKVGGLMRWHLVPPFCLANHYADTPTPDNPASRAKLLLNHMDQSEQLIHAHAQTLLDACDTHMPKEIQEVFYNLTTQVYVLHSHVNVNFVEEHLVQWNESLAEDRDLPWAVTQKNLTVTLLFDHLNAKLSILGGKITSLEFMQIDSEEDLKTSWRTYIHEPLSIFLNLLMDIMDTFKRAMYFILLKASHQLACEKVLEGLKGYRHRRDICFSHAVTTLATSFVTKIRQAASDDSFGNQLVHVGFLLYWESYLSTHGDEIAMLEDFHVAVQDLNSVKIKVVLASDAFSEPIVSGKRYSVTIVVPLDETVFQLLPLELQTGGAISVCAVLLNVGVNEQQSIADRIGDNTLQDIVNLDNHRALKHYILRFRDVFALASAEWKERLEKAESTSEELLMQIQSRKNKNIAILSLMQQLSRVLNAARVTSCKSAKDRTSMAVTLEQVQLLIREYKMDPTALQQGLDSMRSQGTRIQNCVKNVGHPLYAFNMVQVPALPRHFRPPDGTYRKLPS